ncbi:phosphotransferase [Gorillibacterium sp. sgz500922]|uniref:phosphotransferase n=1 Tax=Gorillibacterium sp. sgz500922 TaxID=3446694 RepID=UPI003F6726F7
MEEAVVSIVSLNYDIGDIRAVSRISSGIGSISYFIRSSTGEFVLKDHELNGMNHPENEAMILDALREAGIPVSKIRPTKQGSPVLKLGSKVYHLQEYVQGTLYGRNAAPPWLLDSSAGMLGQIHAAMSTLDPLPTGMSQGFFDYMTPERAASGYEETLELALRKGDKEIAEAIRAKQTMLKAFSGFSFDVGQMTCINTHGDYKLQQIICGKDRIHAVIDFTAACVHPICWEVIRAYLSADPACSDGELNIGHFKRFVSRFLEYGYLNAYDLKIMPYMYYYQNLVSDYYKQYYTTDHLNKESLLEDALLSVKQCFWFKENITKLEDQLIAGF